jgi:hypothetical protein
MQITASSLKLSFQFALLFTTMACLHAQTSPATSSPSDLPHTYNSKSQFGITDSKLFESMMLTVSGIGSSAKDLLVEQNLKTYMMPPRKLGASGKPSTYALSSCLEYYINLNQNYKDNLSPDFLRLNAPKANIDDDLIFLAKTGTISASILPFESVNLTPSVYSAVKYSISNYLKIFQPTTRPQQKIYDVKKAIMRGNPVVVEMQITNAFKDIRQARYFKLDQGDRTPIGLHYVVVVGYDEERKALEIQNCWGRDWGNGGYIWVSYDDFGTMATQGFVLIPN